MSALKRRHVGWAMRARQRAHRSSFSLLVIVGRPSTVKVREDGRFGDLLVHRSGQRRNAQRNGRTETRVPNEASAADRRPKKAEDGRRSCDRRRGLKTRSPTPLHYPLIRDHNSPSAAQPTGVDSRWGCVCCKMICPPRGGGRPLCLPVPKPPAHRRPPKLPYRVYHVPFVPHRPNHIPTTPQSCL